MLNQWTTINLLMIMDDRSKTLMSYNEGLKKTLTSFSWMKFFSCQITKGLSKKWHWWPFLTIVGLILSSWRCINIKLNLDLEVGFKSFITYVALIDVCKNCFMVHFVAWSGIVSFGIKSNKLVVQEKVQFITFTKIVKLHFCAWYSS